ncbi:MAG TPA: glycoside hydrolase family 3 C-terminal domain-containing protein [Mucilaginibacter sp.]|jgi:beta-glucosidase|nr:glycoside hydrolase family 3 C-terminal domain-containing protein [Mucilaginibacter sp.]
MKKFTLILTLLVCLIGFGASAQTKAVASAPQLGKAPLKDVIKALTLEEKAKLVVGMGFKMPAMRPPRQKKDTAGAKTIPAATTPAFTLPPTDPNDNIPEKVPGAAGRTHAIKRLGIPSITVSDGPAGVRINPIRNDDSSKTYYATAWPVGTLLASSWDPDLVHKVGAAFGTEVREYGVDVLLGPGNNIDRNPLGGRNFEYYSEDPLVSGRTAAALINGMQSQGVGTSLKHFFANNQETNRGSVNVIASQRALREIYLKDFEIAIKGSHPWTIMSSYNKVNGPYTSENRELLTTILKGEWGFKGLVMTDWFGGHDPVAQMNAGNDLLMPGTPTQSKAVVEGVNSGKIKMAQLDANVARVLELVLRSPEFKKYKYSNKPDLKKDGQISRMAAAQGMILLKDNDKALPLKGKKIALFGNTSYDLIAGGTGSGNVNKAYTISLVQGLANGGYTIDNGLKGAYEAYIQDAKAKQPHNAMSFFMLPPPIPQMEISQDVLTQQANTADEAIITIGRNAGEGADRKVDNDFNLSDAEKALMKNVADAFHAKGKKVVVVLNIGGVVETASWRDMADGILLAWQPGLEAGNAITDVLSGKVNPSGKLATTFPMSYNDDPTAKNFPGKELPMPAGQKPSMMMGKPAEVTYEEGIYVGYRYYNTFDVKPAYPFGYGLSYTTFKYSGLTLSSKTLNGSVTATVTITNTGDVAGREIVQIYVGAPGGKLAKPSEELRAFGKTKMLRPKESQTLSFTLTANDLESFDPARSAWVAEGGDYTVKVGASSEDIKKTAKFSLPKTLVLAKVHDVLKPQVEITELKK